MIKKSVLVAGIFLFAALQNSSADTRVFKVLAETAGNWNVATNWTGDVVPGAGDNAYIRGGRTAVVTNDVGTITKMYIGDIATWGTTGTVNITGGKLISSSVSEVGRRVADANGTLNISGGTFQSGDSKGSQAMQVGVDGSSYHTTGLVEVSGTGTFIGRALVGSNELGDSNDIFRIIGSSVTVSNSSIVGSNSLEFRGSGSLEFIFDAAGIATASFQEIVTFAAGSPGIVVDGSAYAGGPGTFTLLTAGVLSSSAPTINLVGFESGTTYSWNSTTDEFSVTIPPPTTIRVFEIPVGTSGDWNVATNWSGDQVPDDNETAFVRDGRTANVSADVGLIEGLKIGDKSSAYNPTGVVNVLSGQLAVSDVVEIGRRDNAGSVGTLNISGGTFQAGDSAGSLAVLVGANNGEAATGVLQISGSGTFVGRALVGSNDAGDSGDIFRIVGSSVTVGNTSTVGANSFEARNSGSLEFIFDAAGIATASFEENVTFSSNSVGIVVDGSAYTGANQTFTLIEAGTIAGTEPSIELIGFEAGTTYQWDTENDVFTVSVAGGSGTILEIGKITIGIASTDVIVGWTNGASGVTYALQSKTNLVEQLSWSNRVTGIAGIDGSMSATTTAVSVKSFYQVIVE